MRSSCPTDVYVEACRAAFERADAPPEPETAHELQAFCREWPRKAWMFRPSADAMRLMAVSPSSVDPVVQLPKDWRERFVFTLANDLEFREILTSLLFGEGGRVNG